MEPFVYEPLDLGKPSFRLIRLVQGSGFAVQCELFHAAIYDAEDAIEYEALSYTWGDTDKSELIGINGKVLAITDSLAQALHSLRHPYEDRVLWIDAICIDQDNDTERGHQVQQMASIYENARQVILWLGVASSDTDCAMYIMQRLEQQALNHACHQWRPCDPRWNFLWSNVELSQHQGTTQQISKEQQHNGLAELLKRSWFRRIWVLQEVAKARSAKAMCGTKSVSARIFAVAPLLLGLVPGPLQQAVLDIMPGPSRNYSWWTSQRDLGTLLLKFKESGASDPRDRVYALLGISSDACATDALLPDHTKSMEEVIQMTAGFLFRERLEIISLAGLPMWTMQDLCSNLASLSSKEQDLFNLAVDEGNARLALSILKIHNLRATTEQSLQNINRADFYHRTPMLWAAMTGHTEVTEMYCRPGNGIVNWQDWLGQTPLSLAVENGHEEIVKMLLSTYGIIPGLADWHGRTPLAYAAGKGYVSIAKLLIVLGKADLESTDKSGWTPLALALENGHDEMVQLLKSYGARS